jgi:hypothetical protein
MALALENGFGKLTRFKNIVGSPFKILCGFMLASLFYPCGCLIQQQQ